MVLPELAATEEENLWVERLPTSNYATATEWGKWFICPRSLFLKDMTILQSLKNKGKKLLFLFSWATHLI